MKIYCIGLCQMIHSKSGLTSILIENVTPFQEEDDDFEEEEEEEEEPEDEDYAMPIGPLPQMIFNDLKSLDEMVSKI